MTIMIMIMIKIIIMIIIMITILITTIVILNIIFLIGPGVGLFGIIAYHGKLDAPTHQSPW